MMFFSASVRRDALSAVQLHTAARTAITNPPAKIRLLIPVFIFNIISDKKYNISQFPRQINVPSSQKYLSTVIQAIRDGKAINVTYQSFRKQAPETLVLEPYFLREYKRRWYLYAHKDDDEGPHMFALDRIQSMEIGKTDFSLPEEFNARGYFAGIYGPRVYPDMKAETVILKAYGMQPKYFKSLPLHQSQEIIEETPEYTVFKNEKDSERNQKAGESAAAE